MIIRAHSQLRFQQNKPGAGIIRTGKYRLRELSRSRPVLVLQFSCRGRHRESSVVRLQREGLFHLHGSFRRTTQTCFDRRFQPVVRYSIFRALRHRHADKRVLRFLITMQSREDDRPLHSNLRCALT